MLDNNKYLIISDLQNHRIYFANKIMPSKRISYTPQAIYHQTIPP